MFGRSFAVICVMTLSASAQTPAPKFQVAGAPLCQKIASAAFEANRGLQAHMLAEGQPSPFVIRWLVQSGLSPTGDGTFSTTGALYDCDGAVTDRCYQDRNFGWELPKRVIGGGFPEDIRNRLDDYVRWVSIIGLLPVEGEFLEVLGEPEHGPFRDNYPSGAFLKSVFGRQGMMCAFESRLHERYNPEKPETETSCASLLSDGSKVVEPNLEVPSGVTQQMFRADRSSDRTSFYDFDLVGTLKLDVDGDGSVEHLIKVRGMPSHGRCHGAIYYDVLDRRDPTKFSAEPVRELVQNAQSASPACGYETRIRRVGGRVLFETAGIGLGAVEKQGVPIVAERAGLLQRQLREVSESSVRHLCSATFTVEPVVLYAR